MNAATHVAPASEPSPLQSAQEAALRARRMSAAFFGFLYLVIGILLVLTGIQLRIAAYDRSLVLALIPLQVLLGVAGAWYCGFVEKSRKLAGLAAFPRTPRPRSKSTKIFLVVALVAFAIAMVTSGASQFGFDATGGGDHAYAFALGAFGASGLILFLWWFARSRMWEILVLAAAHASAPVCFILAVLSKQPDGASLWTAWGFAAAGLLCALAGASLELRWRAFVAALPKEGDA